MEKSSTDDMKIMKAVHEIVDSGGSAEIKKEKDGSLKVYEVRKKIKRAG